jgi:hypothetical protein
MTLRAAAALLAAALALGACTVAGEAIESIGVFGVAEEEEGALPAAPADVPDAPAPPAPAAPAVAATEPAGAPMPGPRPAVGGVSDWSGPVSAAVLDVTIVARDERGWLILWQLVGSDPPGPLPADAMALGVFLGSRPTGGYAVRLEPPVIDGARILAPWGETTPAPDDFVTEALTAPYAVTLVTTSPLPVDFDRRE